MSYSQYQLDADAKRAYPNHKVGCLHQGLFIYPAPNCLDYITCYGAAVQTQKLTYVGRFRQHLQSIKPNHENSAAFTINKT
jgi:hypothetical protein